MYEKKEAPGSKLTEARINTFNKIIDVDGFQVRGGLLKGYIGKENRTGVILPLLFVFSARVGQSILIKTYQY